MVSPEKEAGQCWKWPKTAVRDMDFGSQQELHRSSFLAGASGRRFLAAGFPPHVACVELWRRDDGETGRQMGR